MRSAILAIRLSEHASRPARGMLTPCGPACLCVRFGSRIRFTPLAVFLLSVPCLVIPRQNVALRVSRLGGAGSFGLLASGQFFHMLDKTVRTHVGPMLIYEFEAGGTAPRFMNDGPALGNLDEARPKRVLALIVDQNVVDAVLVFKRIGHVVLLDAQCSPPVEPGRRQAIGFAASGCSVFSRPDTIRSGCGGVL